MKQSSELRKIEPHSEDAIAFEWSTGERFAISYEDLRYYCPCAGCVDEMTGQRTLTRDKVHQGVRPKSVDPVGQYAVKVAWTDGHSTGIYHFDSLKKYCQVIGKKVNV